MATIEERGNNTFRFTVSCGYNNSKRVLKRLTWKAPSNLTPSQAKKEAAIQAALFEDKCRKGQVIDSNITLAEFIEIWFKDYGEKQLRHKTLSKYRELQSRIVKGLGHLKLDKINPNHLMEFYAKLTEEGIRKDVKYRALPKLNEIVKERKITQAKMASDTGLNVNTIASAFNSKNVSPLTADKIENALKMKRDDLFDIAEHKTLSSTSILHYHRFLSSLLQQAVYWQIIISNPCNRVKPPRVQHNEARYLDEYEAMRLMEALDNQLNMKCAVITKFLIYTGLRRGECLALEYHDVDFKNCLLTIKKSLLTSAEKGAFLDDTKNRSSNRVFKISEIAVDIIIQWREYLIKTTGKEPKDTDRIFNIHPNNYTKWVSDFAKDNNLPSISPHSLRHTNSTLMIASGASIPAVSKRLGHSTVATTERIYTHAIRSADEKAADIIQDIFNPNGGNNYHKNFNDNNPKKENDDKKYSAGS